MVYVCVTSYSKQSHKIIPSDSTAQFHVSYCGTIMHAFDQNLPNTLFGVSSSLVWRHRRIQQSRKEERTLRKRMDRRYLRTTPESYVEIHVFPDAVVPSTVRIVTIENNGASHEALTLHRGFPEIGCLRFEEQAENGEALFGVTVGNGTRRHEFVFVTEGDRDAFYDEIKVLQKELQELSSSSSSSASPEPLLAQATPDAGISKFHFTMQFLRSLSSNIALIFSCLTMT